MKAELSLKQRDNAVLIEITSGDGKMYRIVALDDDKGITITSVDGAMLIRAKVANQVEIHTDK